MLTSCSQAEEPIRVKKVPPVEKGELLKSKKVLIVYLSRTKNTKAVAEIIHKNVGGDLVTLELVKPYPENYQATVDQVAKENVNGYLPPLKTKIDSIERYDVIFVGFPTWGMQLPPPLKSFLNQYDLSGKTIVPFNTNAGYGTGSSLETVKQLCPKSKVLEGFSTKGGMEKNGILFVMEGNKEKQVQAEIQNWLEKTGFNDSQNLSAKQQALIRISAVTAKGDLSKLKTELNTGFEAGLTINQIREAIVHLYAYAGFPRSIRGLQTLMIVLNERKTKGIIDEKGTEASPINDGRSQYERGKAILEELTGVQETGPKTGYAAFAPEIEVFLKEHLFADIFERDVLTYVERELVTISVLSSIGGVEPMLRSHLNICLNIALTPNQLQQFIDTIKLAIGKKDAKGAQIILDEVLKNKK